MLPLSTRGRDAYQVPKERVSVRTDPAWLPEDSTKSPGLFALVSPVARRALLLGLASREPSFHIFVAADPDLMVESELVRFAERFTPAARAPHPPSGVQSPRPAAAGAVTYGRTQVRDIVYVHDFDAPAAPRPLAVAAGRGPTVAGAMDRVVAKLREEIPRIEAHEEVKKAQAALGRELDAKNKKILEGLEATAKNLGFGIRSVQGGVQTFPILHGKPLSAEQFDILDETTKRALNEAEERLTAEVEKAAGLVRAESARFQEARSEALARAAEAVIDHAIGELVRASADQGEEVLRWLDQVRAALLSDWADFIEGTKGEEDSEEAHDRDPEHATRLGRFKVNLFLSHTEGGSPPIVYETNPTYSNLFGYLERRARYGALLTDFTRIRAGSIHKASGGILIVRAADLLADPIIWERMKRVLRERQIAAEDPLGPLGVYATSLRPVPVPLDVRVVLVGPPELYAALLDADADFAALFRVKVEVERTIPRTRDTLVQLDAYLMDLAGERSWGHFNREARAAMLDLATRLAGEQERLSLSLLPLEETAAFASATALARSAEGLLDSGCVCADNEVDDEVPVEVTAADVELAWRERRERAGAAERHLRELTLRGEVALDTDGERVGLVNGLSVFSAGDVEFGQPMRITAVVALGREGIIDVEREAQLGGSIHTKGVAILRGYLGRLFGQERPLSLRAQIAFEQSYGEVDGDSASSSELFAVLSALADVPVDQGVAVTGSVNQLGEIQAIGGLCAKIEGFFDLCAARGLTGEQGVLIPRANIPHLVLRADVVHAIFAGEFHLYAVDSVEQGIEILTGLPAGQRDKAGRFQAGSVFGRVERRLIELAERLREAESPGGHDAHDGIDDVSGADLESGGSFRGR